MSLDPADSYLDAQIEDIVRTLRSYGVVTKSRLEELTGAAHWREADFEVTLQESVRRGRVKDLGGDLYELARHDE